VRPDGKFFYITCETGGDVFAIDAETFKIVGHIVVHPRPRSIAFLPDGSRAFVPSESVGELNVIDTVNQKLLKVITLPKGSRPQCVLVSPDGKKVYASTGRGGTVVVVDAIHLRSAEHHSGRQTPVGHHIFAGWKISVRRERPVGRRFRR
jgi:DNA-binding beta-propeller fold protein YncE